MSNDLEAGCSTVEGTVLFKIVGESTVTFFFGTAMVRIG